MSVSTASPPKQKRSAEKLDRILDSTEKLLGERDFDDISIQDIVRDAKTSVGVFYSRFSDKEALLEALYERFQARMVNDHLTKLDPEQNEGIPLAEIIARRICDLIDFHRKHTGLLRALVLRGYMKKHWRYEDPTERQKLSVARFAKLVEQRRDEVEHPNPKDAAMLAYIMLMATVREKLLFGHSTSRALRISDKRLAEELTRSLTAYLGVKTS